MDFVYTDYANFKLENEHIINGLLLTSSKVTMRYRHIYDVLEYYYNKLVEEKSLSKDEEQIFSVGFNYLFEIFDSLKIVLDKYFENDFEKLNEFATEVNYLLYVYDFQKEILNLDYSVDVKKENELDELADKVLNMISHHEHLPHEYFALLDDLTIAIFKDDFVSMIDIYFDIADDLGLIDEEGTEKFYDIFGRPEDQE